LREPEPRTIERAKAGDADAFEELVRLYLPHVYRFTLRLLRDVQGAEDATQDAFLNAYRGLPRFRWRSKFSTWLFSIAHNCAIESTRRSARQDRALRELGTPRSSAPDPSLRVALDAAIDALPDDLRRGFVTVEVFGFTYPEAAAILGWPIGTLKSRMHRARKHLIHSLDEQEDAGEV
jgi:RNA polymerase sigma-70 factor, ECF subfamily